MASVVQNTAMSDTYASAFGGLDGELAGASAMRFAEAGMNMAECELVGPPWGKRCSQAW